MVLRLPKWLHQLLVTMRWPHSPSHYLLTDSISHTNSIQIPIFIQMQRLRFLIREARLPLYISNQMFPDRTHSMVLVVIPQWPIPYVRERTPLIFGCNLPTTLSMQYWILCV